jgi:hypothetical protein
MTSFRLRILAQVLPFLLVAPGLALAQAAPTPAVAEAALTAANPAQTASTPQQIDQLIAPIALYPDQLLSQVLMAATYPQQIVAAAQWLQDPNNAGLKGDALVAALQPLPWDPSVKALVAFPQVIVMVSQNIDWTQALGVAFATQQPQVMAQIQMLRHLAMRSDRLAHFQYLAFRQEGSYILIESTEPNQIYVPVYNPLVVYGAWPAAAYPPVYLSPPPGFVGETAFPGFQFSVGYAVVAPLWGWSRPDWRDHRITINRTDYIRITHNAGVGPGGAWRHHGPVALAAPADVARLARRETAAAAPAGTVDPAKAAAVTGLSRRAASEPTRIRSATTAPPATGAAAEHRPAAAAHEQAARPAMPRPATAAHEQAARPAMPRPATAAHEQAARPTMPRPATAAHEQAARPAMPRPATAAHEQAARPATPRPAAAAHQQAARPAAPRPAVHQQAARAAAPRPQAHRATRVATAAHPPARPEDKKETH